MKRFILAMTFLACVGSVASAQQRMGYITINGARIAKCEKLIAADDAAKYSMLEPLRDAIENVEVVKGAAAVRLYGPDAAEGAILITLKKGSGVPPTLCSTTKSDEPIYIVDGQRVESDPAPAARPAADPISRYMYAPELVIAHQEAIGLTAQQRIAIQTLTSLSGVQVLQTQWKLSAGTEKLSAMLAGAVVDEAAVLQQIDQVLALEREIKRAQLSMLIHVKNQLTAAQQQKLDKLK